MHHRDNHDAMSSEDGSVVSFGSQGNHRDEVAAVQRFSRRDTRRIRLWRLVVVVAMLLTGAGVTTWTYLRLVDQEEENFERAVR